MSWFKDNIIDSITGLFTATGDAIDKNVTSDEERLTLKNNLVKIQNQLQEKMLKHERMLESMLTKRHENDMQSDSWLSKNVRPLTLIFLTVSTVLLAYLSIFKLEPAQVVVMQPWVTLLTTLLVTTYSFYFGSRGIEKCSKILAENRLKNLQAEIAKLREEIERLKEIANLS